jgi:hypothetical protein
VEVIPVEVIPVEASPTEPSARGDEDAAAEDTPESRAPGLGEGEGEEEAPCPTSGPLGLEEQQQGGVDVVEQVPRLLVFRP